MTDVLVVAELLEGKVRKNTLSAITAAKTLAGDGAIDILAIGEGAAGAASELTGFGARKVITAEIAGGYTSEDYAPTVAAVAKNGGYGAVIAAASALGQDLLPRVAVRLGAGFAPDVSKIEIEGGKAVFTRPMYAGNVIGKLTVNTPVAVVTVRQTEFEPAEASGGASPVDAANVESSDLAARVSSKGIEVVASERPDLSEAEVVVAGGRSLKSKENFESLLEPLADALGAGIGASRAACDAGYISAEAQIGQTGKVVAPKLYFAIGISGAIQHLAGMKGSKTIVAINKDKEAPIAQVADYFLAADLFDVVPELTEAVKKVKAAG